MILVMLLSTVILVSKLGFLVRLLKTGDDVLGGSTQLVYKE